MMTLKAVLWGIFVDIDTNINFRFKQARKCVISWLITQELDYDEIEEFYVEKFKIDRFDYEKAVNVPHANCSVFSHLPEIKFWLIFFAILIACW